MDEFRIDSHKLMYHVDRVNQWLRGEDVYPIYVEVATAGGCNHRCTFCALDYMEYKANLLDTELLKTRLTEMGRLGVKSIMYAGEGEPLLHKNVGEIINHTKGSGMDVAITTNGVCMTEKLAKEALASVTWVKVSINAGTAKTYSEIHGTKPEDFTKVIENIRTAIKLREENDLKTTIGIQLILLEENAGEVITLAKLAKDIGADYLVVKPYSQHLMSRTTKHGGTNYSDYYHLSEELKALSGEKFQAIFRLNTMKKLESDKRRYDRCRALPFWAYIDAEGGVWGCSAFLGDDRFRYGNIYEKSFEEIWAGEERKKLLAYVADGLDISECRRNCRMDEVNRYLWELQNPTDHVNFI
ncbi:MAG: radical SAM protein [Thermodesulfobacteriota bacterium]